jgi:hypothetical protein
VQERGSGRKEGERRGERGVEGSGRKVISVPSAGIGTALRGCSMLNAKCAGAGSIAWTNSRNSTLNSTSNNCKSAGSFDSARKGTSP